MKKVEIDQFSPADFQIVEKKRVFDGFFKVDKYTLNHKKFDGTATHCFTREVFERGDAVVLIPYDPVCDSVVLNQQFRPGAIRTHENPWMLEFVAGMFTKDEDPIDAAIRETEEEAGLVVERQNVRPVMRYLSSPGGTSEQMHIYVGIVDSKEAGGIFGLDVEDEDIKTYVVSRSQALDLLNEGKITNAATIIGLQWLALNYQTLQI